MLEIIKKINEYEEILIYRHVNPDLDAYGSQLGMYAFLKTNYPFKNIVLMGQEDEGLNKIFLPEGMPVTKPTGQKALAIVLDTANRERIDGDLTLASEVIKIDHHLVVDSYGDMNYERVDASSCAEIVTLLIGEVLGSYNLSVAGARALYIGIVGDSNRFLYRNTTRRTFEAASILIDQGIDIEEIYASMYVRKEKELQVTKYILNHYKSEGGFAYYYLSDETLKTLGISRNEGSNYVNVLSNVEEFKVWGAITENKEAGNIRVSLRSREYPVNEVAARYHGGGHMLAAGATLETLDQLPDLVRDVQEVIVHGREEE